MHSNVSSVEMVLRMIDLIARSMGPTWGPCGAARTQVGPMLAPWTLLSGGGGDLYSLSDKTSVLPQYLAKSWSHEIGFKSYGVDLKSDKCHSISAGNA